MTDRLPVVFVSHGAPDALLKSAATVACWSRIGQRVVEPSAVLVVSAHWETTLPTVSLSAAPDTIHDFSGFSPALYRMHYPAPGAPALAERVLSLFSAAGIAASQHPNRGLDHGAWVPLVAMYPQAEIPVTQLSLPRDVSIATLIEMGRALAPLREEGVLILASGAITHNFGWLDWHADARKPPLHRAQQFADWVAERVGTQDIPALMDYRTAPYGAEAHPTEEHFLPLFVALGAANGDTAEHFQPEFAYGGLAMDAYSWGDRTDRTRQLAEDLS